MASRIPNFNAGKHDNCNVLTCPEHRRCMDIEHPERCPVWRMWQNERKRNQKRLRIARRKEKIRAERKKAREIAEIAAGRKPKERSRGDPKMVVEVATGTVYESMSECARAAGITSSSINYHCKKKDGRFQWLDEDKSK